jgi:hypothetical protein
MSTVKQQVEQAVAQLGPGRTLTAVADHDARRIYVEIEMRFTGQRGATWVWEHLCLPCASRTFEDDRAYEPLPLITPSRAQDLILFPDSAEDPRYAYHGTIDAIVSVLADSPTFEYCIVPIGLGWLICENHHGLLIAVGEPVESRLRAL